MPREYQQFAAPHSEAGHNPLWCEGDMHGQCVSDDPCWSCINWAFAQFEELGFVFDKDGVRLEQK